MRSIFTDFCKKIKINLQNTSFYVVFKKMLYLCNRGTDRQFRKKQILEIFGAKNREYEF